MSENLDSLEKNRRLLLDVYNSMQNDIDSKYDCSDYNQGIVKKAQAGVKLAIRYIEEGQDERCKILREGKYKPK